MPPFGIREGALFLPTAPPRLAGRDPVSHVPFLDAVTAALEPGCLTGHGVESMGLFAKGVGSESKPGSTPVRVV